MKPDTRQGGRKKVKLQSEPGCLNCRDFECGACPRHGGDYSGMCGACPVCGKVERTRKDGTMFAHTPKGERDPWKRAYKDRPMTMRVGVGYDCKGSGQPVVGRIAKEESR